MNASTLIDSAIDGRFSGFSGFGELTQLQRIFDQSFLAELRNALLKTAHHTSSIQVRLGWIDKKPYADIRGALDHYGHPITRPVELGDAAVFVFETFVSKSRTITRQRGVLLQAKVAPSAALPTVPVTRLSPTSPDASTNKELALLSQWPKFELHAANGFRGPLGTFNLLPGPGTPRYGWYAAAPGPKSRGWEKTWKSRWMCGPAVYGSSCAYTLGEVIEGLFSSRGLGPLSTEVGASFSLLAPGSSGGSDWDRLCTKLHSLSKKYAATSGPHGVFTSFPYLPGAVSLISKTQLGHKVACWMYPNRFPVLKIYRSQPD